MEKARLISDNCNINTIDKYTVLKIAEFHDIGYADCLAITGFHPLDGYTHIIENTSRLIATGVLMHTHSQDLVKYTTPEIQEKYKSKLLSSGAKRKEFDHLTLFINIVSLCDMQIDSTGKTVTLEQRYTDLCKRYGATDYRAIVMNNSLPYYKKILQKLK